MTTPQELSPEAKKLQAELTAVFVQISEVFKKLGEPRYTIAEIKAALVAADVDADGWIGRNLEKELTRARAAKL